MPGLGEAFSPRGYFNRPLDIQPGPLTRDPVWGGLQPQSDEERAWHGPPARAKRQGRTSKNRRSRKVGKEVASSTPLRRRPIRRKRGALIHRQRAATMEPGVHRGCDLCGTLDVMVNHPVTFLAGGPERE